MQRKDSVISCVLSHKLCSPRKWMSRKGVIFNQFPGQLNPWELLLDISSWQCYIIVLQPITAWLSSTETPLVGVSNTSMLPNSADTLQFLFYLTLKSLPHHWPLVPWNSVLDFLTWYPSAFHCISRLCTHVTSKSQNSPDSIQVTIILLTPYWIISLVSMAFNNTGLGYDCQMHSPRPEFSSGFSTRIGSYWHFNVYTMRISKVTSPTQEILALFT